MLLQLYQQQNIVVLEDLHEDYTCELAFSKKDVRASHFSSYLRILVLLSF